MSESYFRPAFDGFHRRIIIAIAWACGGLSSLSAQLVTLAEEGFGTTLVPASEGSYSTSAARLHWASGAVFGSDQRVLAAAGVSYEQYQPGTGTWQGFQIELRNAMWSSIAGWTTAPFLDMGGTGDLTAAQLPGPAELSAAIAWVLDPRGETAPTREIGSVMEHPANLPTNLQLAQNAAALGWNGLTFTAYGESDAIAFAGDQAMVRLSRPEIPTAPADYVLLRGVAGEPDPSAHVDFTTVLQGGDAAPGGGTGETIASIGAPVINASGVLAFVAEVDDGTAVGAALFRGTAAEDLGMVIRGGDAAPVEGLPLHFTALHRPSINAAGDLAFRAGTDGAVEGVFLSVAATGSVDAIATRLDDAPGEPGTPFSAFGDPVLNDAGQVAFRGQAGRDGIWTTAGADPTLRRIVGGNDAAFGIDEGIIDELGRPVLNAHGVVAYTATLEAGGMGLWLADGYGETVLVDTGSELEFNRQIHGGDANAGLPAGLNDHGQVVFFNADHGLRLFTPELHWRDAAPGDDAWDNPAKWTLGQPPGAVHHVTLDPAEAATIAGPGADLQVSSLVLGDGETATTLNLGPMVALGAANGIELRAAARLTGAGRLNADVVLRTGAAVSVDALEITGDLDVPEGAMVAVADGGAFSVSGDITQAGTWELAGNAVAGAVANAGTITIQAATTETVFADPFVNTGTVRVEAGATVCFLGGYSGTGAVTGPGTVKFCGGVTDEPGIATRSFDGDVVLPDAAVTRFELSDSGDGDRWTVAGAATLDGTLRVEVDFAPDVDTEFVLFDASGGLTGSFDELDLPDLGLMRYWDTSRLESHGILAVRVIPVTPEWTSVWTSDRRSGSNNDQYGTRVVLQNNSLVVAERRYDVYNNDPEQGAVYFYELGPPPTFVERVIGDQQNENFGREMTAIGNRFIAATSQRSSNIGKRIRIYRVQDGDATQVGSIYGPRSDRYAEMMAGAGDDGLLVSYRTAGTNSAGVVYYFRDVAGDGSDWEQQLRLEPSDGEEADEFGFALSSERGYAAVGALYGSAGAGQGSPGAVYLFDLLTGEELLKLDAGEHARDWDRYGVSVELRGRHLLVGQRGHGTYAPDMEGAAYLYEVDFENRTATLKHRLTASDGFPINDFGIRVTLDNDFAYIGATRATVGEVERAGAVYVFDLRTGAEVARLVSADPGEGASFGNHMALEGNLLAVAATNMLNANGGIGGGQVSLFRFGTTDQFWNGSVTEPDGIARGGDGTWSADGDNWTDLAGTAIATWNGTRGVFAGEAGTVTVEGTPSFGRLSFTVDGYRLEGDLQPGVGGAVSVLPGATVTLAGTVQGPETWSVVGGGTVDLTGGASGDVRVGDGTLSLSGNTTPLSGTVTVAASDAEATARLEIAGAGTAADSNLVDTVQVGGDLAGELVVGGETAQAVRVRDLQVGSASGTSTVSVAGASILTPTERVGLDQARVELSEAGELDLTQAAEVATGGTRFNVHGGRLVTGAETFGGDSFDVREGGMFSVQGVDGETVVFADVSLDIGDGLLQSAEPGAFHSNVALDFSGGALRIENHGTFTVDGTATFASALFDVGDFGEAGFLTADSLELRDMLSVQIKDEGTEVVGTDEIRLENSWMQLADGATVATGGAFILSDGARVSLTGGTLTMQSLAHDGMSSAVELQSGELRVEGGSFRPDLVHGADRQDIAGSANSFNADDARLVLANGARFVGPAGWEAELAEQSILNLGTSGGAALWLESGAQARLNTINGTTAAGSHLRLSGAGTALEAIDIILPEGRIGLADGAQLAAATIAADFYALSLRIEGEGSVLQAGQLDLSSGVVMDIVNGGAVMVAQGLELQDGEIGYLTGSDAEYPTHGVTVTGAGSNLTVAGEFGVGRENDGSVLVSAGGVVDTAVLSLAGGAGRGAVEITGAGSRVETDTLWIGRSEYDPQLSRSGELRVADGGELRVSGDATWVNPAGVLIDDGAVDVQGNLRVEGLGFDEVALRGGRLEVGGALTLANQGALLLDGGELSLADWSAAAVDNQIGPDDVAVDFFTGTLRSRGDAAIDAGNVQSLFFRDVHDGGDVPIIRLGSQRTLWVDGTLTLDHAFDLFGGNIRAQAMAVGAAGELVGLRGGLFLRDQTLVVSDLPEGQVNGADGRWYLGTEVGVSDGQVWGSATAIEGAAGSRLRLLGGRLQLGAGVEFDPMDNLTVSFESGEVWFDYDVAWNDALRATFFGDAPMLNTGRTIAVNGTLAIGAEESFALHGGGVRAQTLVNDGVLSIYPGMVEGEVDNRAGGVIEVNADATFTGAVQNAGEIVVASDETATFAGGLAGLGTTGDGAVAVGGRLAPGFSPGVMHFGGDLTLDAETVMALELAGLTRGDEYDIIEVSGDLTLAGTLEVVLGGEWTPGYGEVFDLLDWAGALSGTFAALDLPTLGDGLQWDASRLYDDGSVRVMAMADGLSYVAVHDAAASRYTPGGTVAVGNRLEYEGAVEALTWSVLLPEGWTLAAADAPGASASPDAGTGALLEWTWTTVPASPVEFSYTLRAPAGAAGEVAVSGMLELTVGGATVAALVAPDPLTLSPGVHSADTDGDWQISLSELLRVIELYNTRFGTQRTGAYTDSAATEDGFAGDPRDPAEADPPARFHSGDFDRDGTLSLSELLRVIELYNTRAGTVRTGAYRPSGASEDGFEPDS